jgi:hypothetical protein
MVIAAICLLVFGALGFVACGGGDDDDADTDAATATQQSQDNSDNDADDPTDEPADPTDASSGGGGGFDASEVCNVLSKEEVESAFGGVSMLDPEYIPLPDVPLSDGSTATVGSCSYTAAEAADSFSLTVYAANEEGARALFDQACSNKDSAGVGDDSCWFSEAHTEIQMLSGGNFVDMFVTTVDGDSEAILLALAGSIAGQLG